MKLVRSESELTLMNLRKTDTKATTEENHPSFEEHFEEHWASVYRVLLRMVGDPAEAEDLALETFYRLYQRNSAVDSMFNVGGWLFRVATNLGLQSIRGFKRRVRYETEAGKGAVEEAPENRPAEIMAHEAEKQMTRMALSKMNPRRSQLLLMRYSGMAYQEIATALNLSPTSIGPLLLRAEREFEKCYRALAQEEP